MIAPALARVPSRTALVVGLVVKLDGPAIWLGWSQRGAPNSYMHAMMHPKNQMKEARQFPRSESDQISKLC